MVEKLKPFSSSRSRPVIRDLAERRNPDRAADETVALVQIRSAVFQFPIDGIDGRIGAEERSELPGHLAAVDGLAQGVVRQELDTVAHALAEVMTIELYQEFTSL